MKLNTVVFFFLTLLIFSSFVVCQDDQVSPSEKNPKAFELVKRAIQLEDAGMFEAAIRMYLEVLKIEPKDFTAMNTIAGLYGRLENPEEEVIWAKKAIATNPKYFQAYINYGNGLGMQGKFEDAVKAYQEAQKLAPKNPLPVYSQGVIAENQNRFKDALGLYLKSIELDPKFENGLFSAAAMHANLRQFNEAKILLKRLIEINPRDEDAKHMLQQIEREKP